VVSTAPRVLFDTELIDEGDVIYIRVDEGARGIKAGDYLQIFYVGEEPWVLQARMGSFVGVVPGTVGNPQPESCHPLRSTGIPHGTKLRVLLCQESGKVVAASCVLQVQRRVDVENESTSGLWCLSGQRWSGNSEDTPTSPSKRAPWLEDMPPMSSEALNEERESLVETMAREMSSDEEVWAMECSRLRDPPPGDFEFDYEVMAPRALAALKLDTNIQRMRYRLVPSTGLTEELFWEQYFYRLGLIQAAVTAKLEEGHAEVAAAEAGQFSSASGMGQLSVSVHVVSPQPAASGQ